MARLQHMTHTGDVNADDLQIEMLDSLANGSAKIKAASQGAGNNIVKEEMPWLNGKLNKREQLECEYMFMQKKHKEMSLAEEALVAELSSEMLSLRDHCNEQGQAVGQLTARLSEAHDAVTAELHNATIIRQTFKNELEMEQATRQQLQINVQEEQAEIRFRIQASEQQFSIMQGVRSSLEGQVEGVKRRQEKLRQEIEDERAGRCELHSAGVQELDAWKDHNVRLSEELRQQLEALQEEEETWRAEWSIDMLQLEHKENHQGEAEARLQTEVDESRRQEQETMVRYESEAIMWRLYVSDLRERLSHREAVVQEEDAEEARILMEHRSYEEARARLYGEVEDCKTRLRRDEAEVENHDRQSKSLREELAEVERALQTVRERDEKLMTSEKKVEERLNRELEEARREQSELEEDVAIARKSMFCGKRRPPSRG